MNPWRVADPQPSRDHRTRWPDEGGDIVPYSVVIYRAAISRLLDTGQTETRICGHPHSRKTAARKCALVLADSLNHPEGARS